MANSKWFDVSAISEFPEERLSTPELNFSQIAGASKARNSEQLVREAHEAAYEAANFYPLGYITATEPELAIKEQAVRAELKQVKSRLEAVPPFIELIDRKTTGMADFSATGSGWDWPDDPEECTQSSEQEEEPK